MEYKIPQSYVAIDLETTGLNPKIDKIIEIGAIRVQNGVIVSEKSTLVNPRMELSAHTRQLTGIDDGMVADAPGIEEVIEEYVEFCEGFPLLGHKVLFDYSFMKRAAVNQKLVFEKNGIDTLDLCRRFMPGLEKKTLECACEYYRVPAAAAHRALNDAYGAHGLYQALIRAHGETGEAVFSSRPLIYKIKREQPASKRQKEVLRELIKYHRIDITVQIDYLSRNEISRLTDKIISQYGRIVKR